MSSGSCATTSSAAFAAIRGTLAQYHAECAQWQREVEALFDDFLAAVEASQSDRSGPLGGAVEGSHAETAQKALADTSRELIRQQSDMLRELQSLRGLVEEQSELLSALMAASVRRELPVGMTGRAAEAGARSADTAAVFGSALLARPDRHGRVGKAGP